MRIPIPNVDGRHLTILNKQSSQGVKTIQTNFHGSICPFDWDEHEIMHNYQL